jgi:hypothetical protein
MVDVVAGNHCHLADELAGLSFAPMLGRQRKVVQRTFTNLSISLLSIRTADAAVRAERHNRKTTG